LIKCWGGGCDAREILAALRRLRLTGGDRLSNNSFENDRAQDFDDRGRRIELARRIWNAARDARGSPVARYLASRGIDTDLPPSLRWAPALRRTDGTNGPAMVARIDSIDGELIGISRTWLIRDDRGIWERRDRAMLGRAGGGAVRLAPVAETLMIGEGVETSLAAMQACSMPTWAALSTSGMTALRLPPIVRTVIILADHDANGAGERSARIAAQRWRCDGRQVSVWMSPVVGEDVNDLLLAADVAEVRCA
jgi:hypothetical protein